MNSAAVLFPAVCFPFLAQFGRLQTVLVVVRRAVVLSIIHGVSGMLVASACVGWNRLIDDPGASTLSSCGTGHNPRQAKVKGYWQELGLQRKVSHLGNWQLSLSFGTVSKSNCD